MEFSIPNIRLDPNTYDHIISLGNKCLSRIALDELKLAKASFPFDWLPTQPALIKKYLLLWFQYRETGDETFFHKFFPKPGNVSNDDKVWFGHFNCSPDARQELVEKYIRRFRRFEDALSSGKLILFLYTSEADVYNELNSCVNKTLNYIEIKKLIAFIKRKFPQSKFDILYINTNDERPNETVLGTNIFHWCVYVLPELISLNMETHVDEVITPYRKIVTKICKAFFFGFDKEDYKDLS